MTILVTPGPALPHGATSAHVPHATALDEPLHPDIRRNTGQQGDPPCAWTTSLAAHAAGADVVSARIAPPRRPGREIPVPPPRLTPYRSAGATTLCGLVEWRPLQDQGSGMTRTQAHRSDACLPGGVTRGGGVTRCGPSARPLAGRAHRQVNGYRPPRGRDPMMARGPGQARTVHDSIWSMGRIRSYGIKVRTLDPRICLRASRGLATAARSPRCSPPCTTRCTARGSPPRPHPARHRTATSPPPPPSR